MLGWSEKPKIAQVHPSSHTFPHSMPPCLFPLSLQTPKASVKMSHSLRSLRRLFTLRPKPSSSVISTRRHVSTETRSQKLERIADDLLLLDRLERHDFSVLWRLKLGLDRFAGPAADLGPVGPASGAGGAGPDASAGAAAEEKTVFDIKLEKYDAASKIKIIKEVRAFTDLGLKEAKDLVEKVPCVLKKGLTKDEADPILQKLKDLGATVVLD
ncbi:hypothetical protein HN51_004180 [Arachis hypogaea]|uniref:Uncharacterized protein LOC107483218 n=1 Tax=Arachis duranensis TaxID=130453 RepID=A0A6P4D084_ARADU|nr:uncharacterized protein LOC107483218 [Arachis duranensis]XP_025694389.1 uncharacterized protein LOC112796236 [Arachis hypogaea]